MILEIAHFVNPLIFYGLVNKGTFEENVEWNISTFGRRFVEVYKANQFDKCQMLYVQAIMSARYPNDVTPTTSAQLYPYQIFYYLLKNKGSLSKEEIINGLVYINTYDDLNNFDLFLKQNLIEVNSSKPDNKSEKFWSWKIKEWEAMKLIKISKKNRVSINLEYQHLFENYSFNNIQEAFFSYFNERFQNSLVLNKNKINQKRSKELREMVYKRDNWNCVVDFNHQSFLKKNKEKYLEAHHFIPLSLNDSWFLELDDVDNLVSLCSNCHRQIHHGANSDVKIIIDKIFDYNKNFHKKFGVNNPDLKEELYNIYFNSIYRK